VSITANFDRLPLDYSKYAEATIIHDLNQPIPKNLHSRYETLIDGGSIEHIFNFPQCIMNYKNLIKDKGNLFICTVANNYLGHGFYQFSPELFFRIFDTNYGFKLETLVLHTHPFPGVEMGGRTQGVLVNDPMQVGSRVGLVNNHPVHLLLYARKISSKSIAANPIQSDYQKSSRSTNQSIEKK